MSWISIKDKMPEKFQSVFVADICYGAIHSFAAAMYVEDGYFSAETGGLEVKNYDGCASITIDMDITHWMPLPNIE